MAYGASNGFGARVHSMRMAVEAWRLLERRLPKEARDLALGLEQRLELISRANARQERAKAELANATKALARELEVGAMLRGRLVSYAEAMFGRNGPEMRQFRPLVENRRRRRRQPEPPAPASEGQE